MASTRKRTFPCSCVQTSLVKWLPGYQANVLYRYPTWFSFKFRGFLSTVGFSNEDNCCKSQEIGKLIKEKPWKGIFKVDWLINVAANTQISSSLLLTSGNNRRTFLQECFFEFLFFPRNHTWKLEVRLISECDLYTSLYGNSYLPIYQRFSTSDSTTIVTGSDILDQRIPGNIVALLVSKTCLINIVHKMCLNCA